MRYGSLPQLTAVCFLLACAPAEPRGESAVEEAGQEQEETGKAEIDLCDAVDYRSLIGANIASTSLPTDPMLRAFSVDDIITQEYLPRRTNIVYDPEGKIIRVYCG